MWVWVRVVGRKVAKAERMTVTTSQSNAHTRTKGSRSISDRAEKASVVMCIGVD